MDKNTIIAALTARIRALNLDVVVWENEDGTFGIRDRVTRALDGTRDGIYDLPFTLEGVILAGEVIHSWSENF